MTILYLNLNIHTLIYAYSGPIPEQKPQLL